MKFFYVHYKSGSVGRCMAESLEAAISRYRSIGIYNCISFIEEIKNA